MADTRFLDDLIAELRARRMSIADSPVVERVRKGELSREDLLRWALQFFPLITAIPKVMKAVHDRASADARSFLKEVVDEEAGGEQSGTKSHPELFLDFVERLGYPREMVLRNTPPREVADYLAFRWSAIETLPWHLNLVPNVMGEGEIPRAYRPMIDGFQRHYGLRRDDLLFFTVHEEVDRHHFSAVVRLLATHAATAEDRSEVARVFWRTAELFRKVWDSYANVELPVPTSRE
jgi:pyrroloquinoline quinone (PQQ) biosynthesis protein C